MCVTWGFTYFAHKNHRPVGQRVLTATIFAFFVVASNDFALGFPVINALYGQTMSTTGNMTTYIAANALVGSVFFVPLTTIFLGVGGALREQTSASESKGRGPCCGCVMFCRDLLLNPIIAFTILGIAFKACLGGSLTSNDGVLELPHPLLDVVNLLTAPFGAMALFLTGTSLRSPAVSLWPMVLVLMKVAVCAFVSYFLGGVFVGQQPMLHTTLRNFVFFYGSLPTSSAPLLFTLQHDQDAVELVATAILFGILIGGPFMFMTALFLERADDVITTTLIDVQLSSSIASVAAGAAFVGILLLLRRNWDFGCMGRLMVCAYGLVALAYEILMVLINPRVFPENCKAFHSGTWSPIVFAIGTMQNMCRFILLLLLVMHALYADYPPPLALRRKALGILVAFLALAATVTAFVVPSTLNEICQAPMATETSWLNAAWSIVLLAITAGIIVMKIRRPRPAEGVARSTNDMDWCSQPPHGVIRAITTMQTLRFLTQVVNASQVLQAQSVMGTFGQMLVLENMLEHGQLAFFLVALFFDQLFMSHFLSVFQTQHSARTRRTTYYTEAYYDVVARTEASEARASSLDRRSSSAPTEENEPQSMVSTPSSVEMAPRP
eukprot:NODE_2156_length_2280_cov_7.916860.p1 GENE.NODE_2156_length_2280_cov_7.916860~~NODE_2156_length_2280_cov_7.916860.p1  ORF type:complete len:691 (+),score=118.50 NODE_2156_length_2280_cov_7.916860:245-2074(+)